MDIALLQMAQSKPLYAKAASSVAGAQGSSFDKVLHEATHETVAHKLVTTHEATAATEEAVADVVEVVEAEDVKTLLDVLGIEYDESLAFVQIEGELVPMEELMNTEQLTAALGMTPEQLQQIVSELLGEEVHVDDVWAILEQAPALLAQVAAVLQGENTTITPKEAGKLVEFLKLAETVGLKQDTVYQQEFQLKEAKQGLQTLVAQLSALIKPEEPKANFQQLLMNQSVNVEPIQQPVDTQQSAQQQSQQQPQQSTNALPVQPQQSTQPVDAQPIVQTPQPTVKTITVTLPTNPAAQSEALVKELENAINRSQIGNNQGQIKLMLKLFPENLGQIRVELFQKDGVMQARLLATSAQTKELLDASLNQLKTALAGQNIQMDRIDVAQTLQSTEQGTRDQHFFNNFFRQQHEEQEEQKQEDEEQQSFDEFLEQFNTEEVQQ